MKKVALATLMSAAISTNVIAQDYDPIYAPSPEARNAAKATLVGLDQGHGHTVAAGLFGTIVTKQDEQWQQAESPTSVLLTSVDIVNEDLIFISGHEGVLLKSNDGGQTFTRILDGFELLNLELPWIDAQVQELEAAIDNAETPAEASEYEYLLEELGFLMQGLEIQQEVGPTKPLLDVEFINESVGVVAAAYGTLLRTEDGGESWEVISDRIENPLGYHLNQLIVDPDGHLFLVGEYGLMFRSDDQGKTWSTLASPYHGSYFGGLVDSQGRFWAFGLRGNVFVSEDKGETFRAVDTPTRYNLNSGHVLEDGSVLLVGHSGVIVHIDEESLDAELYSHESNVPLAGVRETENGNLVFVSRAGIQNFTLPAAEEE
ncbi:MULTISPECIES: YCF48-related protein [Gammaproteobacteria]|uniref:WD40/YVTN/BNR-like repeat-containing protein n=1 Tax=Gammaproteobacteria TaxID=1236 RepID=UPI00140369D4|nr:MULTISPECIES: YCF48-related protein [Gammaproteobacteria]